jgi:hypothetical protein
MAPLNDPSYWRGDIEARVKDAERRLDLINGQIDGLRTTVNRWSGALAVLVIIGNVIVGIAIKNL